MPSAELAHVYSVVREWCLHNFGEAPTSLAIGLSNQSMIQLSLPKPEVPSDRAFHSPDFRSVNWFGHQFKFTPTQAACVKMLWHSWENGAPEIGQQAILEEVESPLNRMEAVFRDNPAWGTMIVVGETRGTYRLQKIS